jgi:hypothetical protein
MTRILVVIAELGASALSVAEVTDNSGEAAFARIRTLTGEWAGTFAWTGARQDSGTMNATYYLTGNNSAVVENLTMGGVPTMTSVYHLNGGDLRMTHYCAAGNQPRLKAERIDTAQGMVDFSFVDATNLSPKERHSWIKLAQDFGYEAHAVFFDVPAEVCMDRNRKRQRNVPEEIMRRMAAKLKPPTFEEGFAKITVVRLKR